MNQNTTVTFKVPTYVERSITKAELQVLLVLCDLGKTLDAVTFLKEQYGWGWKTSKDLLDHIQDQHRPAKKTLGDLLDWKPQTK